MNTEATKKFGTFQGVFLPSILTIFGVIMYLRLAWIVGNLGLFGTITLVTIATLITFITGLSISTIATNMRIKGGGAYYMISRSLGLEAGAAIGIPLYISQALGISFYLSGFSESIQSLVHISELHSSLVALFILTIVSYVSLNFALKIQLIIFLLIIASLLSFFSGGAEFIDSSITAQKTYESMSLGFWGLFAIFFPAVTGIEAGLSMSGTLKKASLSLPLGTLSAIAVGYFVYIAIPIFLTRESTEYHLLYNSMVFSDLARYGNIVLVGIWGASLSSALGGLLGAPQTLQALAKDKIVPSWIGAGFGKNKLPRFAILLTCFIAGSALLLGSLNIIAPILSMFFLTSYGMINFSAAIQALIGNPSWRPDFKVNWMISAFGSFLCFSAMFLINPGATIIALILTFGLFYLMHKRKLTSYWGDMQRGILMFLAKSSIEKLNDLPSNSTSWRPNILVLSGPPKKRMYLTELGQAIANSHGFLTVSCILNSNQKLESRTKLMQNTFADFFAKRRLQPLLRISFAKTPWEGMTSLVRDYGLGPIFPNTIIMGECHKDNDFFEYSKTIIKIHQAKRNILIFRFPKTKSKVNKDNTNDLNSSIVNLFKNKDSINVAIWWGRQRKNAGLSLACSYLIQNNSCWPEVNLKLKSIVNQKEDLSSSQKMLETLSSKGSIKAECKSYIQEDLSKEKIFETIREKSQECDLSFIGIFPPSLQEYEEEPTVSIQKYANYLKEIFRLTSGFLPLVIVLANEDLNFHKIFTEKNE